MKKIINLGELAKLNSKIRLLQESEKKLLGIDRLLKFLYFLG